MASIAACHAADPGSIPGGGELLGETKDTPTQICAGETTHREFDEHVTHNLDTSLGATLPSRTECLGKSSPRRHGWPWRCEGAARGLLGGTKCCQGVRCSIVEFPAAEISARWRPAGRRPEWGPALGSVPGAATPLRPAMHAAARPRAGHTFWATPAGRPVAIQWQSIGNPQQSLAIWHSSGAIQV